MSDFVPLRVSNHALLRYIERVVGIDVEALRAEIADLAQPGSPELAKIIVEDGVVVTILGGDMRARKNGRSKTKAARHVVLDA
jgi:hypothetical protein